MDADARQASGPASPLRPGSTSTGDRCSIKFLLAALVAALILSASASARAGCHSKRCELRVAAKQCSQRHVVPCIRRAALQYRVPFPMLLRKARCESGLNPRAVGFRIHRGLFQFNWPGTWRTTPYASRDAFSAKWNALAAAWMHSVGRGNEWQCR